MSFAQPQSNAAQAEGRRIYVGNLNYELQVPDIEGMLVQAGFPNFESVKIPVDPGSQRNRGYAFVDFPTREEADRSLNELQAVVGGREIKVRPCEPKQQGQGGFNGGQQGGYNGGGGFNGGGYNNGGAYNNGYNQGYQNNYAQPGQQQQRWGGGGYNNRGMNEGGYQDSRDLRKLYVGGLGPNPDQESNEQEIMQLFQGFTPSSISKRLESNRANPDGSTGAYNFCFVEFENPEEANAAKDAIDGRMYGPEGNQLRVSFAKPSRSQGQGQGGQQRWPRQQGNGGYGQQGQGGYGQQGQGGFGQQQGNWRQ